MLLFHIILLLFCKGTRISLQELNFKEKSNKKYILAPETKGKR